MASKKPTHSSTFRATAPSIAQAEKQTERRPSDDRAWQSLGLAYLQQQRVDDAASAFQRAVELAPDAPEHREWISHTLFLKRENDAALGHLDHAQQQRPDSLFALTTRARVHLDRAQGGRATGYAQRAAELAPKNTEIQALLAQALHLDHQYSAAIECFKRLCKQEPRHYQHWNNLGNVYRDLALIDEAIECYRKASELAPKEPLPFSNWITGLHYDPKAERERISRLALEWQSRFAPADPPARPVPADRRPDKQLRIGMLSDGFRQHPVGKMIVRCLENLSSVEFELFAYTSNGAHDPLTDRIRGMCQQWLPVQHLSDDEFAQRIRDDAIDIFFDLSGHNAGTRMRAVAMRPAPLIVKWVGGLINTTGVEAIDYLLSDPIETPSGDDAFYSEKLIRMPGDYIVFDPPSYAPDVGELPARRNGYVTLGCFNNPSKLNDVTLAEWARILNELPDARLMLKGRAYGHTEFCDHIYTVFEDNGIARERLILEGPGDNREMLQAYNRVDIALDPWPYSGGLTTCEGFLMGVPVVTLPGPTFAGRHSATHLINAGMPELVTSSWDEYRARVTELAVDLENLATIRRLLRDVLLQSPVCDGERFAQHFTTAMRAIWTRYCDDKPPTPLTLDSESQAFFDDSPEPLSLSHPRVATKKEDDFDWTFQGKIIAVDNGGQLLERANVAELLERDALELVVFDPAGQTEQAIQPRAGLHFYANNGLGDGKTATLHACLDPAMSSLLEPLAADPVAADEAQGGQVLATLPFQTVALDDISGLPRIEWLALDHLSDSASILEHGRDALKNTLLIQARVAFQPTHARQPNLAELQHWACRNGFRFYRLHDPSHRGHLPDRVIDEQKQASELVAADALFLPDRRRMQALDENERMKLAFLLHHIYGLKDAAHTALAPIADSADRYVKSINKPERPAASASSDTHAALLARTIREMTIVNGPLKRRPHGLPGKVIISLTSYPARFATLHLTLLSLLTQTVAPDRTVLWIAHNDRDALPKSVTELAREGLEIRYCEDLRSYKKIIPALKTFPNAYIATADDDCYYPPTWLEELVDLAAKHDQAIPAHRIHRIRLDEQGYPLAYQNWTWNFAESAEEHPLNFPTGIGGVLYPPGCFHPDVANPSLFEKLCPNADDIWLYWMARLGGYRFIHTGRLGFTTWPGSQADTLFSQNITGGNDEQLSRMMERYGLPLQKRDQDMASMAKTSRQKSNPNVFRVGDYWNTRYENGGNSGAGSYGRLAEFKAEVINSFIARNNVTSLVEFGCGDGNQLALLDPGTDYLGVDISPKAVAMCRAKFETQATRRFLTLEEFQKAPVVADAALSLDVIYHLVDDETYHSYMTDLFRYATRFCVVYSANVEERTPDRHVRKRRFTDWVELHARHWALREFIPNKYPYDPTFDPHNTSFADFYIFENIEQSSPQKGDKDMVGTPEPSEQQSNPTAFRVGDDSITRYENGGNSGARSYGRLAEFEGEVINRDPIAPFFIVGPGRCGTTLLRRLLIAGPGHVHIPPENWSLRAMIEVFRERGLDIKWEDMADLCTNLLMNGNEGWFQHYPSDLKKRLVALQGEQRTLAGLIDATYRFHGHTVMETVERWGDKTPLNVGLMPELIRVFPNAKFVFMLRDPADTIYSCSLMEQYQNDVRAPAKRWAAALESLQEFEDKHPDSILTVRYEDLVQDADSELRRVCEFLALEFHPSMLANRADEEQLFDLTSHAHHAAAMKPITQSSIGKGREKLTDGQKTIISELLGDSVSQAGYEPLQ